MTATASTKRHEVATSENKVTRKPTKSSWENIDNAALREERPVTNDRTRTGTDILSKLVFATISSSEIDCLRLRNRDVRVASGNHDLHSSRKEGNGSTLYVPCWVRRGGYA